MATSKDKPVRSRVTNFEVELDDIYKWNAYASTLYATVSNGTQQAYNRMGSDSRRRD